MKQEEKASGFGYGTDSIKQTGKHATKTDSFSLKKGNSKITVDISKRREMSESPHYNKYTISKYDLHPGYLFPELFEHLIPTSTPEYVDSGQRYVERIIRALYYFKQCALIGPSGTGKTHITYLVAELTGLPVWEVNCGLQTSSYDLIGRFIGLGKENWIDGQVTSWLRFGGLLYLDEANMMKQDVATRLNPVLDTRGHLVLTEKDNEIVARHPYAYLIISMNPFSSEFAGTKPLNAAFRRRMSVWINFDYESVGEKISSQEVELLIKRTKIDEDTGYKIIRVGAEMRRQYKAGDLPYAPSIGDLVHWAILIKDGSDPITAAEETIVALTSDSVEIQGDVRRLIEATFSS
ncbi:MAG: CbbQ/NirQ/NorQ/GpvN family protein [Candidatus Bathyarchaeota archaeon]|nr:CbbQ/NirQ/NorQ/GpvN family protein [Candidatus Bathyarchaeota archaeon]MDH5787309.1 CbbQ/NirQ/NorQ/GpvN family protein [Candidatus Bathyarchaeota archaeon]